MKKWLGLTLSLLLSLQLGAREVQCLSDALKTVRYDSIVVLDIDDTLIAPCQMVASTDWGHHRTSQLLAAGCSYRAARAESTCCLMQALEMTGVAPVEPETVDLVSDLQDRGIMVIGLTARPADFCPETHHQLETVGLYLSRTAPPLPEFALSEGSLYSNGILFSWQASKGKTLSEFFQVTGIRPAHLVYVDDSHHHIATVVAAMAELEIPCDAFRYGGADKRRAAFDAELADYQWEMLGRILSDDLGDVLAR